MVVPGGSTRLAEVMSAGCIPVLVGDDYVPPFAGLLDWSSLALTVSSTCIDAILPRLRAMRPAEVEAIATSCERTANRGQYCYVYALCPLCIRIVICILTDP